ncbi:MAG: hypothetical protein QNK04_19110 [Myxococcota bacterium]|nr:hypothetical protein [Myxococcota bacterium]
MTRLPPVVALLAATCVLVAAAAPCPPGEPLRRARAAAPDHDPHLHDARTATARPAERVSQPPCHGEEPPPLLLTRPCACGCQKDRAPRSSGGRLGFALARAPEPDARPAAPVFPPSAPPLAPTLPTLGRDPIPI